MAEKRMSLYAACQRAAETNAEMLRLEQERDSLAEKENHLEAQFGALVESVGMDRSAGLLQAEQLIASIKQVCGPCIHSTTVSICIYGS